MKDNNILITKAIERPKEQEASVWELFSEILQLCLVFFQNNFIDTGGKYKAPNLINPVFIWKCITLVRSIMGLISDYKEKNESELKNT